MESEKQDLEIVKESQTITAIQRLWDKRIFGAKEHFAFIISILLIMDMTILLNIPFLRQILGFLFLTILPGVLIIQVLKLDKQEFIEKFILSWGISISFLMLFGLLINNLSLSLGYETPLSTVSLLITFNLVCILLSIIAYKINKDTIFTLPNPNLSTSEKAFLTIPILFPALSIFGMRVMNATDNNIILMFLLFLIPAYVAFVCFFNHKFPSRLYPVVIFSISISLLLLLSLRSNHILGGDIHKEYYLFQITLDNLHWYVLKTGYASSILDACLSISLLPTIYQSILNVNKEYLYKILYSLLFTICPLVIYVISKKYLGDFYGFLASCFFMFQTNFLWTAGNPRTSVAVLFFALAMIVLFNDKIDPLKKRILFIVFMASCMVSHYSTTYIFFFILLGSFLALEVLSKKYTFKKVISVTLVLLFFAFIFLWYSQVTETAFGTGVGFVEKTFSSLNKFFVEESRNDAIVQLAGRELEYPILSKINFVITWSTFILIGIGVFTMIMRYKEMIDISNVKVKKPDFLKTKFEMEYLAIVLMCVGLLVLMVVLPHVSRGYGIGRLYSLATVILSVCFVMGGVSLSHFLSKERTCAKKETLFAKQKAFTEKCSRSSFGKAFLSKKRFVLKEKQKSLIKKQKEGKNGSQARAYLIILLILIPYFLFYSGAIHQLFGIPTSIILNSEGKKYDHIYVYDSESCAAKWLMRNAEKNIIIHTTGIGGYYLISQGKIAPYRFDDSVSLFIHHKKVEGYIYLYYDNVVEGKLRNHPPCYNISEYSDMFIGTNKIYGNGGSEVYKT